MKDSFINRSFLVLVSFLVSFTSFGSGEKRISRADYISTWKNVAIENMQEFKIPASITLAQAILESGDGNSELAKMSNNHFGIKCHDWKGERVYYDDDKKGECFRKYTDAGASFVDHSKFLLRKRYESLFDLNIKDYKGWARGLKKCGYATNPAYARLLIDLIEKNDLHKYDDGYSPAKDVLLAKTELEKPKDSSVEKGGLKVPTAITLSSSRSVQVSNNNIKFVQAREGESVAELAEELDLPVWLIRKYNDLSKDYQLKSGELIYIQPKRAKGKQNHHVVQSGESMRDVSQLYGIKLKTLYKKNSIKFGAEPKVGTKLLLKGKVKS